MDLPGFGLSTASSSHDHTFLANAGILEAFVKALDLSQVTLFLHDTAGPIGLDVASRHPNLVRGLVLSSTFGFPLEGYPEAELFLKLLGWRFPGHFLVDAFNILVLTLVMPGSPGVKRRKFTRAEKAAYYGPYKKRSSRRPMNILFGSLLEGYDYLADLERRLSGLGHLPVLLLPGEKSGEIELGYPERFGKIFPNSRTEILHGAAHYTPEDAPMEIVTAVRRWWDEEAGKAEQK